MSKLKTSSSVKKRFKQKSSGVIVARCIGKRHNLRKIATKLKKFKTGFHPISQSDVKLVKKVAPYGINK